MKKVITFMSMERNDMDQIPAEALETTLEWLAKFNRHEYFTKELYKKLPKYKKCGIRREKTEIQVAFICKALQRKGIYMTPCGVDCC